MRLKVVGLRLLGVATLLGIACGSSAQSSNHLADGSPPSSHADAGAQPSNQSDGGKIYTSVDAMGGAGCTLPAAPADPLRGASDRKGVFLQPEQLGATVADWLP